ncbi:MAG TPA: orotate phosphoribosyltransferase [Gemmatimonadaceae bacterium]|nr:orotate phosphoribosyltransferase [Gemmatimonadaceae bacterium]
MVDKPSLAAQIASVATLYGDFTLRSGAASHEYFDKYRFESDPRLLDAIAQALVPLIPPATEALAGLELGGVPIATALALRTGLHTVFVRKRAKDYGTRQLAEGRDVRGLQLLLVEDVVTSGGQVIASANELRSIGSTITDAICVIDREAGGERALARAGIRLHSLFRKADLERLGGAR